MAVGFIVTYQEEVVRKDIPSLPKVWKDKIKSAIEEKLATRPDLFGKPLRRSLKGYRRLRVGDYRIVFRLQENAVLIFAIVHRSIVYQEMENRW